MYAILLVVWLLLVGASLGYSVLRSDREATSAAFAAARVNIDKDLAFRKWAAHHGGVYVPVTELTQPNPLLDVAERDLTTPSGKALTLMNPAYMLRQLQQQFPADPNLRSHISSDRPLNPANRPDPWEAQGLAAFASGQREFQGVSEVAGQRHARLMKPFVVEASCLKCHAKQGYKIGDLRGGISSSVALSSYIAARDQRVGEAALSHGLLGCIGLLSLALGYRRSLRAGRERERLQAEADKVRATLQATLDAIPDLLFEVDQRGVIHQYHTHRLDLLALPPAQFLGRPFAEVLPAEVAATTWEAMREAQEHGVSLGRQYSLALPAGRRTFELSVAQKPVDAGELPRYIMLIRDITQRLQAEEAQRAAADQYRLLFEHMSSGFAVHEIIVDAAGVPIDYRFLQVNQAFCRLTGLSEAAVVGRRASEVLAPLEPAWIARYAAVALGGAPAQFEDYAQALGRWYEVSAWSPVHGQFAVAFQDITERRQAKDQLLRLNAELEARIAERTEQLAVAKRAAEQANVAKSAFLATMSHEIRTPLGAITGLTHLMRRGGVTPQQADQLARMDAAGRHLLQIINAVLDLSKIEAGKFALEVAQVNVAAVLANVASMMREAAEAKGLRLVLDVQPMPSALLGDPTRLQQALLNYVGNAIKFSDAGAITLAARLLQDDRDSLLVRFEVQDQGMGVAAERIETLFGAFEQGDGATARRHGGTGLGLAITRRLAELMGGSAGASSAVGEGSTFWFTARLRKGVVEDADLAVPADHAAEAQLTAEFSGRRVLLADDEPINREVTAHLLAAAGLQVDTAVDGSQALAMAQAGRYDLILMDMQMPNLDGLQATALLRQVPLTAAVPIVAMTANAFAEDRARCLEAGMDDFVSKPVDPQVLFAVLLRWLRRGQGRG